MDLEEVVKDIEENALFTRGISSKIFKSMLNQPTLVSVNSANAVKIESENGYYTFKIDFPRPILDVDTIQLLTTSIPQANASIPNTAIAFWYYRLSNYSGTTPSLNNLYCVRLLPSYYKPEFISNPGNYGWNKTFPNYASLATELAKSCVTDLGYYNQQNFLLPTQPNVAFEKFPFLPGDISITYNSTYNKFQMTGNTSRIVYQQYDAGATYIAGVVIYYTDTFYGQPRTRAYTSLQDGNLNHTPSSSPTWWQPTSNEIVAEWKVDTTYLPGNFVRYFGVLYRAVLRNTDITPDNDDYWTELFSGADAYTYLITGYEDPNVAIKQGELFDLPWEPTHYYQTGERVRFKDRVFRAITEGNAYLPGNVSIPLINAPVLYYNGNFVRSVPNTPIQNWTILTPNPINQNLWSRYENYEEGDLVYYGGRLYKCKLANINVVPFVFSRWDVQAEHPFDTLPWSSFITYPANSIVSYNGATYITSVQSSGNVPGIFGGWVPFGRIRWQGFNFEGIGSQNLVYFNGNYFVRDQTTADNGQQPVLAWNIQTSYPANAFVSINKKVYRSIVPNQSTPPVTQTTTWSSTQEYTADDTVILNNTQYRSRTDNLNAPPSGLIEWTAGQNWIVPNIVKVTGAGTYRCYQAINGGNVPNNEPAYWEQISADTDPGVIWEPFGTWEQVGASNWDITIMETDQSGLNGLSVRNDFIDNTGGNNVKADFPEGIPGQPFNPAPERLLNSILGFTWNGIFVPSALTNLNITIAGKSVSLYNRLRPVPNYEVERNPALVGDPPNPPPTATVTRTYTAEGYANLVYSSIVNIYTNIIGGSTLDTVRNTNLVATTSMNCGNLGIAFHGNYIDAPLQRVAGDINELTIELRDEVGEPFFLTNNAIMTATFKVTYKDGTVRIEEPA